MRKTNVACYRDNDNVMMIAQTTIRIMPEINCSAIQSQIIICDCNICSIVFLKH
jgi:hypothetical protein